MENIVIYVSVDDEQTENLIRKGDLEKIEETLLRMVNDLFFYGHKIKKKEIFNILMKDWAYNLEFDGFNYDNGDNKTSINYAFKLL